MEKADDMTNSADGYSRPAILIHWASAFLILVLIASGFRSGYAEDAATKAAALRVHVPVAIIVLLLTVTRLGRWWRFDTKPAPMPGIPDWQETIARWTHKALYLFILLLLASGIAMSVMSGLPAALFGSAEFPNLADLPPRAGHGVGARLMLALVVLHAGAAAYHHLFLKDNTLKRMWFGKG